MTAPVPAIRTRALTTVIAATEMAVRRFPLVVAASIAAAIAGIVAVGPGDHPDALRALATATLALPLLFTVTILTEQQPRGLARWLMLATALVALAAFWTAWAWWMPQMCAFRYVQLSVAFHLLAACAPFLRRRGTNAFWQYNKTLFLRALTAAIYTGVLFVGLAIALAAINKLFGANLPGETYPRLWCLLAFVFSTCVFVGGVPLDVDALETQSDYPSVLRTFTQFVLVPLVAIYLLILTVYLVKVLVTQQWPSGWIGYLVSSVAVVGILSWLLVHPLEERPEFGWVKPFTRGVYIALMPAIVMLWLATWQRVNQYGITEPRYFLVVLSGWLAIIAVYYTLSRSRNIKLIPASLCLLALGTFAGPTGAYSVSRASQMGRLERVLLQDSLLVNGRIQVARREVPEADRIAITSGFRYLVGTHGYLVVAPWLTDSLRRAFAAEIAGGKVPDIYQDLRAIMASMNVEPTETHMAARPGDSNVVNFFLATPRTPRNVTGFTIAVDLAFAGKLDSVRVDDRTMVKLSVEDAIIHVVRDGVSLLDLPLPAASDSVWVRRHPNAGTLIPTSALRIDAKQGNVSAALFLTQLGGLKHDGKLRVGTMTGELFLRLP